MSGYAEIRIESDGGALIEMRTNHWRFASILAPIVFALTRRVVPIVRIFNLMLRPYWARVTTDKEVMVYQRGADGRMKRVPEGAA